MKSTGFGGRGGGGVEGGGAGGGACSGICRRTVIVIVDGLVVARRRIFARTIDLSRDALECRGSATRGRGVDDGLLDLRRNAFGKSGLLVLALVNKDSPVSLRVLDTWVATQISQCRQSVHPSEGGSRRYETGASSVALRFTRISCGGTDILAIEMKTKDIGLTARLQENCGLGFQHVTARSGENY